MPKLVKLTNADTGSDVYVSSEKITAMTPVREIPKGEPQDQTRLFFTDISKLDAVGTIQEVAAKLGFEISE